jgi:hypothetical protein
MAIDRGDYHHDDAGSWDKACRHIGRYLAWAAARGLASDDHDAKAALKNPTKYFISACDMKLWDEDFNPEGLAFTTAQYNNYLRAHERYAKQLGVTDYEVPDSPATTKHFHAWLDAALVKFRAKKKPVVKKKPAVKKPATKKKPAAKKKQPAAVKKRKR